MAITFNRISGANFNEIFCNCLGDGVSTVLKFAANKAPFDINYGTTLPTTYDVNLGDPDLGAATAGVATDANGDNIITVNFSIPPSATIPFGLNLVSVYQSLP